MRARLKRHDYRTLILLLLCRVVRTFIHFHQSGSNQFMGNVGAMLSLSHAMKGVGQGFYCWD